MVPSPKGYTTLADCTNYICPNCGKTVEAWSDGNPYYFDEDGKKAYAYHPDHELLDRCIGNDEPHICLACGDEFMVDSRAPIVDCTKCGAGQVASTMELEGKRCPACGEGIFCRDADHFCIS